MSQRIVPETILEHLGTCGRYQIFVGTTIHMMKLVVCWTMYGMVIAAAVPKWHCEEYIPHSNTSLVINTSVIAAGNVSEKQCFSEGQQCASFKFDTHMKTIVSEWEMICSLSWIPSMIASLQMAGLLVGCLVSGHLADAVGRKLPLYASLLVMLVFNVVGYFSVSWIMFAVARVGMGIGIGFFMSIQYTLTSEVTCSKGRAVNINIPSWHVEACLFAFVAWLIRDWRKMHLITGLLCIPFIATWWCIQESFRWYVSHDRSTKAIKVLQNIAKFNKRQLPDDVALALLDDDTADKTEAEGDKKKYSVFDLFKSRFLAKITLLMIVDWIALGMVTYGIQFGIQALSGNFFMNIFLIGVTCIPSNLVALALANTIGRRYAGMLTYGFSAAACLTVGVIQNIEFSNRDTLTNAFALAANFGIQICWGVIQTLTIELYPTVVRNIGYGFQNTIARVGAIIGPQIAFLDTKVPGIMYFTIGGLSTLCVLSTFLLPETKDASLEDKIVVVRHKQTQQNSENKLI